MIVSLIIRAYNEERHIGKLLRGISQQKGDSFSKIEIILVDSGSQDNTIEIARSYGASIIKIKKEEFSFGRAINIGCAHASGDILVFASAHIYPVCDDWIEKMVSHFSEDEKIALVYGRQTGNELTKFSEQQVFGKWFPEKSNKNQSNPFCNNANCAIRASLWKEQKYDEILTGLEDIDWAKKIIKKDFKIVYDAEAVIIHIHEETMTAIRNRYRREAIALKQIMPEVHVSRWDFIQLLVRNILTDYTKAFRKRVFLSNCVDIMQFRFNQFYGTYLGHNQKGEVPGVLKNKFYYPSNTFKEKNENYSEVSTNRKINYDNI